MEFIEKDEQNNIVDINEKRVRYLNAASVVVYYAQAYIDLNGDSIIDQNELFALWSSLEGEPLKIQFREESRWEIQFNFSISYN